MNEHLNKIIDYNKLYSSYYTNYPPVGEWKEDFINEVSYDDIINDTFSVKKNMQDASLYVHFPYCNSQCYFCHCHTIISKDHKKHWAFLEELEKEVLVFKEMLENSDGVVKFVDIHLGGGSPSGMNSEEFTYLKNILSNLVEFDKVREFSIEIDIRFCDVDKIKSFADAGITRISFGLQDFNVDVQQAINRIQPFSMFEEKLPQIRDSFNGINFDLIYGMPHQSIESFSHTIDNVLKLSPDRIALYKYNHKPDLYKHQGFIENNTLPSEEDNIKINYYAIEKLLSNGYIRIGIDHFAKKTDSLGKSALKSELRRNFMGYTAGDYGCTIGFGPSSMSDLYGYYVQNTYDLKFYRESVDNNRLPLFRGYKLSQDDILRREIIYAIMNNFKIDFLAIEKLFDIKFDEYFASELMNLDKLENDDLIIIQDNILSVTPVGKYCLRNIAVVFDSIYSKTQEYKYSKDFIK